MENVTQFSQLFENGIAIGVIIILFIILFAFIKLMMEQIKKYHDELKQKDMQLTETIKEFDATILKINDAHDKNLQYICDSNDRIEAKVDKIIEKIS